MTTPEALKVMRRARRLGCVWLFCLPLLSLLLWVVLTLRQAAFVGPRGMLGLERDMRLADHLGIPRNVGSSIPSLEQLEQQMTNSYWHVQMALFVSSERQLTPRSPLLATAETLQGLRNFKPLLTAREKARLLLTLHILTAACRRHGLTFFLLGSSLVGSLRHHGVVPWSDVSVTLAMRDGDKARLLPLLKGIRELRTMWSNPYSWSVHLTDFFPDPPALTRLTFLVVQFYRQNTTHVWADTWGGRRLFTAPEHRVFPLIARPFEGLLLPAPCDASSVLGSHKTTECRGVMEDEEEMEFRDAGPVPCDVLARVFPFVTRRLSLTPRSTVEQVSVNGTLLQSILVDTGCAANSVPVIV